MISTPSNEFFPAQGQATTARLGNLLEEYGEVTTVLPVLAGLFITSRLQLRGAQALLVNITIAAVTRQVVLQLKKQAHAAPEPSNGMTVPPPQSGENGYPQPESSTAVAEDYMIVHSVPGRIRLRIPRLMVDWVYAKRLEKLLQAEEMVLGVRINRSASSLVIQYDGAGLSELELGLKLLQILDQAEQLSSHSATN